MLRGFTLLTSLFDEQDIEDAADQVAERDQPVTGYLGNRRMSPETEYEFREDDW